MKYTLNTLLLCVFALLLTACGDDKRVEEPVNSAPKAIAGVGKTVQEKDSVVLDARASMDQDGDELSYQWTQISGPTVVLSNSQSVQPSFVTPDIDAATDLVFELHVSDPHQEVSTDTITITVLDQALAQQKKQVLVYPVSTILASKNGEVINVAFEYQRSEDISSQAGLMLKLHWNSSLLSFNGLNEVLAINHLGVSAEMLDDDDSDYNADTDKYVIISWLDYENADWLDGISLPAALFSASFVPMKDSTGSTQVTLSPHFTSPEFSLHSQLVSVEL